MDMERDLGELEAVLDATGQQLTRLYRVLENEHLALRDNDLSVLEAASNEKHQLSAHIDTLEKHRSQLIVQAGFTADATGMAALVGTLEQQYGPVPQLVQRWQALQRLIRKCDRQNRINGLLLERSRHRVAAIVALLQGGGQDNEIYDPHGATVVLRAPASLAHA